MQKIHKIISTFFYSGLLRPASGTWGSLAYLVAFYVCGVNLLSMQMQMLLFACIFALSVYSVNQYCLANKTSDPKEVVIDEVLGLFASLMLSNFLLNFVNANQFLSKPIIFTWLGEIDLYFTQFSKTASFYAILNFAFFRLLDITKPYPASFFDKKVHNSFGVIMDDIIAGIYSALATTICVVAIC